MICRACVWKAITVAVLLFIFFAGSGAAAAPMAPYATVEGAANAALADAEALTGDFEAGGAVYQCGTAYAYLAPVTQSKKDRVDVPVAKSAECQLAALYHTHPKGDARFSAEDVRNVCKLHTVGFILPHGGTVISFDCRALARPAILAAVERATHGL
jgi:proteasome lid subunit RPN8/RPN11